MGKLKIIVVVIVLALIAYFLWNYFGFGISAESDYYQLDSEAVKEFGVDPESIERNTLLYSALVDAGIENAVADVTKERVLVRFELPEGMNKEAAVSYILGVAAEMEPNVSDIVVQVFKDEKPVEEYKAKSSDVKDYSTGKISDSDFETKVTITPL